MESFVVQQPHSGVCGRPKDAINNPIHKHHNSAVVGSAVMPSLPSESQPGLDFSAHEYSSKEFASTDDSAPLSGLRGESALEKKSSPPPVLHNNGKLTKPPPKSNRDLRIQQNSDASVADAPSFDQLLGPSGGSHLATVNSDRSIPLVDRGTAPSSQAGALSLARVLSQSLRTDDDSALSSIIDRPMKLSAERDLMKLTLGRLDPKLAPSLLSKLASSLHSQPRKASNAIQWLQAILVVHGAYLATQPHCVMQLREVRGVLAIRSRNLGLLLKLRGKMNILDMQMKLQHQIRETQHERAKIDFGETPDAVTAIVVDEDDISDNSEAEYEVYGEESNQMMQDRTSVRVAHRDGGLQDDWDSISSDASSSPVEIPFSDTDDPSGSDADTEADCEADSLATGNEETPLSLKRDTLSGRRPVKRSKP